MGNTFVFFIAFNLIGCFSFKPSSVNFQIQDPEPAKERKNIQVWIKPIILPQSENYTPKENTDLYITYNLYKFVRELKQFDTVNIQYSPKTIRSEKSILVEFQFSKLQEDWKLHSLFFPMGLLGFVISRNIGAFLWYEILGGPSLVQQMSYKGELVAYDFKNQEIGRVPINLESEFNVNRYYYEVDIQTNEKRKEMLDAAFKKLIQKWETK